MIFECSNGFQIYVSYLIFHDSGLFYFSRFILFGLWVVFFSGRIYVTGL